MFGGELIVTCPNGEQVDFSKFEWRDENYDNKVDPEELRYKCTEANENLRKCYVEFLKIADNSKKTKATYYTCPSGQQVDPHKFVWDNKNYDRVINDGELQYNWQNATKELRQCYAKLLDTVDESMKKRKVVFVAKKESPELNELRKFFVEMDFHTMPEIKKVIVTVDVGEWKESSYSLISGQKTYTCKVRVDVVFVSGTRVHGTGYANGMLEAAHDAVDKMKKEMESKK